MHLLFAADRLSGSDRTGRQGEKNRDPYWSFSIRGQWQGNRAWRGSGTRESDFRQKNRTTPRRTHDRGGGNRAHPGLRGSDESRNNGRRADPYGISSSNSIGDDEGSRAGRLRPRIKHIEIGAGDERWPNLKTFSAPS